jgi:hypothetical protein
MPFTTEFRRIGRLLLALICLNVLGQSPDASVLVLVTDSAGKPLANAEVSARLEDRGYETKQKTGEDGVCFFGALSPGLYTVTVSLSGYVSRSHQGMKFEGASRQQLTLVLFDESRRARNAPEDISSFLGALPPAPTLAAETVASSVSVIIDEDKILQLPLLNRNVYSLFLLEPGVTSQGATARRGLTFSVHGQRVSGSNYLLDGVDNNNIRLTGPVTITSVDGIQEMRMVKSSFSADNGRATSFVAPLLTRAGANAFHGTIFGYLGNDAADANTFANNAAALPKPHLRQLQAGFSASGPIIRNRTFFSSVLEFSKLRFSTHQTQILPTHFFISTLPPESPLKPYFAATPPLPVAPSPEDPLSGTISLDVPNKLDRLLGTARLDHIFGAGRDRLTARYTTATADVRESTQFSQEYRGYDALWATDLYRGHNSMIGWVRTFESGPVNELRAGWNRDRTELPRPYADRPLLAVSTSLQRLGMPSSSRFAGERQNNNVLQLSDMFQMRRGRSSVSFGADVRKNFSNGISPGLDSDASGGFTFLPFGYFQFADLQAVLNNAPEIFGVAVDRFATPYVLPDLAREYRSSDYSAWVQNDIKLTRRLSVNLGLRWEYFGVIHNTDRSKDVNFYLGSGSTPQERLKNGMLRRTTENPGDLAGKLYRPDTFNLAPSAGIAWDPFGRGLTVVRAGFALAFDRIYDTARDVRTNTVRSLGCPGFICNSMLVPIERMLAMIPVTPAAGSAVIIDENLRTPYAQNWYVGLQQNVTRSLVLELGHAGSAGRRLVSRDIVNRSEFGPSAARTRNDTFITNQGSSSYAALEAAVRQRVARGLQYQLSYTWSHAIDNQSDLLEGIRLGPDQLSAAVATFTRALDPRFDRGSANFDQRHSFVINWIWDIPGVRGRWDKVFSGWSVSGIGAHRSGFPITAIASQDPTDPRFTSPGLRFNRLDVVGDPGARPRVDVPGGRQWLFRQDFQLVRDRPGTLGRNALAGPGSWNYDMAVMRTFAIRESRARVQIRAEFYNLFNHANLLPPVSDFSATDFGVSYAGRSRTFSRFGELPLDSPSRRIQFAVRIRF